MNISKYQMSNIDSLSVKFFYQSKSFKYLIERGELGIDCIQHSWGELSKMLSSNRLRANSTTSSFSNRRVAVVSSNWWVSSCSSIFPQPELCEKKSMEAVNQWKHQKIEDMNLKAPVLVLRTCSTNPLDLCCWRTHQVALLTKLVFFSEMSDNLPGGNTLPKSTT